MINNRQQAGRRRGRGGNGNGGGNGPRQGGGQGRADNGNRIDNRSRGNANQLYEKYKTLAADAQRQGDRVNTEYYLQFADHYFRVLSDQRGRVDEQPQQRRNQPDFDIDGADDDYGDEGEPIRAGEQQGQEPQRDRQDGNRQNNEYQNGRQEPRGDRQRDARRPDGERAERPRRWERDDRPRAQEGSYTQEGEVEIGGQHRADPVVPGEDLATRAETVIEADAPLGEAAPRRRGRPRRDTPAATDVAAAETSRSNGVGEGTVDADRLPPSLGVSLGTPANDADDDDAPKPRRRRLRSASAGDAPAE